MRAVGLEALSALFEVPVERSCFRAMRHFVRSFARDHGLDETAAADLALAVTEALHNAAEHGARGRCVGVGVRLLPDRVEVAVEDDGGRCADAARLDEVRAAFEESDRVGPGLEEERGRGLALIRMKSDQVRIESGRAGGVRLVVVKRR